jgi:hypothetical protein
MWIFMNNYLGNTRPTWRHCNILGKLTESELYLFFCLWHKFLCSNTFSVSNFSVISVRNGNTNVRNKTAPDTPGQSLWFHSVSSRQKYKTCEDQMASWQYVGCYFSVRAYETSDTGLQSPRLCYHSTAQPVYRGDYLQGAQSGVHFAEANQPSFTVTSAPAS